MMTVIMMSPIGTSLIFLIKGGPSQSPKRHLETYEQIPIGKGTILHNDTISK